MTSEIHPTVSIQCDDLIIGKGSYIGPYTRLHGNSIHIGRQSWIGAHAYIGGGSAFDPEAYLKAGDFFHLGDHGEVNIARGVDIGDEVGLGVQTRIFTHGAWLSELDGYPCNFSSVSIGDRIWVPNGQVNPGSVLGSDSVYLPGSVVSGFFPPNSLVGGNPAKVLKENHYPRPLDEERKVQLLSGIIQEAMSIGNVDVSINWPLLTVKGAVFDVVGRTIDGPVTPDSEVVRNQLRRHGVRFRYDPGPINYVPWS